MINKMIALGRLGQDGELKTTTNGNVVYNNSIALSEKFKTKSGEAKEKTTWINFVIWQKAAEIFAQYTQKGSQVFLEGKWENETFEKDGQKRTVAKLIVSDFKFLDTKGGAEKVNANSNFTADDIGF